MKNANQPKPNCFGLFDAPLCRQTEITIMPTIEISTDEYADLLSARTRLDVVCDILETTTLSYTDKELLLVVAQGISTLPTPPEAVKEEKTPEPKPLPF